MDLEQTGQRVQGSYLFNGTPCTIEGEIIDGQLSLTYQEPTAEGEGTFTLSDDGQSFTGQWRPLGTEMWGEWRGERMYLRRDGTLVRV